MNILFSGLYSLLTVIDNFFEKFEKGFLIFVLTLVIGLSFYQVILRNLFSGGFIWADSFLRNMVLWLGLLGASLATKKERHINIDIASRVLPTKGKYIVNILLSFISIVVCVFLFNASLDFIKAEKGFGSEIFKGFPSWIVQIVFPVAFGIMVFRFGLHIITNAKGILKKSD